MKNKVLRHGTTGVTGIFYKRYRPTGCREHTIMVNTSDGRQFYAPESQWEEV